MKTYSVVEILGDGISAELSRSVHAVAQALPCRIEFVPMDLSLESRQRDGSAVYDRCVEAMQRLGLALKYPTTTTTESPNQILRDRCDFSVIHRPVATIPGIQNNFKRTIDIEVIRVATGGTYDDPGMRICDEAAVSIRKIEKTPSRHAARFAFELAQRRGGHVVSTSKWTIQRATDGLFEEAVDEVRAQYPAIQHRRELFDSLLAGIIMKPERYSVIVTPNEYGDFLSDSACGLIGSIGLGDSASYSFDTSGQVQIAMFDPAGGTAPDIAGKDLCNPTAALLALANLLGFVREERACAALRMALFECIAKQQCTRDVGGVLSTSEFTAQIAQLVRADLV